MLTIALGCITNSMLFLGMAFMLDGNQRDPQMPRHRTHSARFVHKGLKARRPREIEGAEETEETNSVLLNAEAPVRGGWLSMMVAFCVIAPDSETNRYFT